MIRTTNHSPNQSITLRCVRFSDAAFLLQMENDPSVWAYGSQGEAPYSLDQIEQFCRAMEQNSMQADASGQLRLIICMGDQPIGAIDLYDCCAATHSAKIAILIYPAPYRSHGYGKQALRQMIDHCIALDYTSVEAEITPQNKQSRKLFESCGFAYSHTTPDGAMIYTL